MKTPTENQIAVLIPLTIFLHQLEEYFGQFPNWFSNLMNAQLSNQDFIVINSVGLFVFTLFSLSYFFNKKNTILVSLGTLVFVNGVTHITLSVFTYSYSPGVITSIILFLPLGILIFKRILPKLNPLEKIISIGIGIIILIIVSMIAINI